MTDKRKSPPGHKETIKMVCDKVLRERVRVGFDVSRVVESQLQRKVNENNARSTTASIIALIAITLSLANTIVLVWKERS